MASVFTVTSRLVLAEAVNPIVGRVANEIARAASGGSPRDTGALAGGWQVKGPVRGGALVFNDTPHARYQEYGTRHIRARGMFGRAVASARGSYGR
jgi:hypothetical protein